MTTWAIESRQLTYEAVTSAAATSHHRRRLQRAHVASPFGKHLCRARSRSPLLPRSPRHALTYARGAEARTKLQAPASPPPPEPVQRGRGIPQSPFASRPRCAPFPALCAAEAVKRGTGAPRSLLAHSAQPRARPRAQADAPVQRPRAPKAARPLAPSRVARQAARARLKHGRVGSRRETDGRWDTRTARRRIRVKALRAPRWLLASSDEDVGEAEQQHGSAQREQRCDCPSTRSRDFLSGAATMERPPTARERRGTLRARTSSGSSMRKERQRGASVVREPRAPPFMSADYLRDLHTMRLEAAARSRRGEAIRAERGFVSAK